MLPPVKSMPKLKPLNKMEPIPITKKETVIAKKIFQFLTIENII